jgi:hypothetical protein
MADFIVLANSDASLSKRFKVLVAGYAPAREKVGARRLTVTGKVDNQVGPVLRRWRYVLLVHESSPPANYGTLANLKTLFELNDPWETPSNVIAFTDFDEVSHSVYITGMLAESPVSYAISGTSARFEVEINLEKTTA